MIFLKKSIEHNTILNDDKNDDIYLGDNDELFLAQKRRIEKKDWEKKREVSLKERGIEREKGKKKKEK